jgi:hypothetical protein
VWLRHEEKVVMRYQNRQIYCECQLIAIWNAARFWGRSDLPEMGTADYKKRCERAAAIAGGAIFPNFELKTFGLVASRGKYTFRWVCSNLPTHFAVFCHRGYHSVLVVEVKGSKVLLVNYAKGRTHWMEWTRLLAISNRRVAPVHYVPLETP